MSQAIIMIALTLHHYLLDDVADMLTCNDYPDASEGRHPNA